MSRGDGQPPGVEASRRASAAPFPLLSLSRSLSLSAGIGGAYSWLAGREAGRLLAKMAKDTGVRHRNHYFYNIIKIPLIIRGREREAGRRLAKMAKDMGVCLAAHPRIVTIINSMIVIMWRIHNTH